MIWANFLHIYQPPTQKKYWIDRVTEESYRKIIAELKKVPEAKMTLNINACLTEMLYQYGHTDVISDIKALVQRGQIELTASAKFHPLLTRIPKDEVVRQIKLNDATNRRFFGSAWKPRGFFPPEMAFDYKLARIIDNLGYEWVIVDGLSYGGRLGKVQYDKLYRAKGLNLKLFFRERETSFKILSAQLGTGALLVNDLGDRINRDEYLLTAMDGETFGHHRLGLEQLLFDIYRDPRLPTVTISELLAKFPKIEEIMPRPSTWALMEKDLERNKPFSRWDDPQNKIHRLQWKLTDLVVGEVERAQDSKTHSLLDRALHSDQYWWASARPWWSLEMIERGAFDLLAALKAVPKVKQEVLEKAIDLYLKIITTGFAWQRLGKVDELAKVEDEEIRQLTDQGLPELEPAEIAKMVANLDKQRLSAASGQEYERAAQFRDRIKELKEQSSSRISPRNNLRG